jgi:hypothetical protein
MYKIVRSFLNENHDSQVIKTKLTLAQAQQHCKNPETSSSTCATPELKALTEKMGEWFDGYDKM